LSPKEAEYLKDQLDIWIEGYSDVDASETPPEVVLEMLDNRETAERIRGRIWKRLNKNRFQRFLNSA